MGYAQRKGASRSVTIEAYRFLAMLVKHYDKWFGSKDDKKVWHENLPKGRFKILARKMISNGSTFEE